MNGQVLIGLALVVLRGILTLLLSLRKGRKPSRKGHNKTHR